MAWCGASPHSTSISSPLWFKFNRWEHRRDTAAIKAACYLHIISQSITLTSRGAHFSPAQTHPRPTTGPPLCLLCAPACWLGDFGAIWHSTTAGRRVRSSLWSSQEAFIILGRGKISEERSNKRWGWCRLILIEVLVGGCYNWAGNKFPLILYIPHLQYIHTISSKSVFTLWGANFCFNVFYSV